MGSCDDAGEFEALGGATDIETVYVDGRVYGVVAAYDEDAIQIIDLINPDFPIPTASVHRGDVFVADEDMGREDEVRVRIMDGPRGVAVVDIADRAYCVVVGQNDDSLLILDVANPAHPWPVSINYDRLGGIEALNGAADVELAPAGDRILAVVSGSFDDAVQIIDVTDPANPVPLHAAYDNSGGYDALNGADDVEVFRVSGSTYVMVASIEEESIQIARLGP